MALVQFHTAPLSSCHELRELTYHITSKSFAKYQEPRRKVTRRFLSHGWVGMRGCSRPHLT